MEEEKHRVPLFDGTNYGNWKFRMETLLEELGLSEHINSQVLDDAEATTSDGDTAEGRTIRLSNLKKRDAKCKSQIIQRIADSHLEYAKDKRTAFDIWTELKSVFERRGIASQLLLRKKLLLMKFKPSNETLASHFLKFETLVREIKSTGATMQETDIVCHLFLTMPQEYDIVVTALETLPNDALTLGFVKNRLLDEEAKRGESGKSTKNEKSHPTAFTSSTNDARKLNTRDVAIKSNFNYRCYNCGIVGHRRSECRKSKQHYNGGRKTEKEKEKQANIAVDKSIEVGFSAIIERGRSREGTGWILDSGASEHLTNNESLLVNTRLLKQPVKIRIAKAGMSLIAKKVGEIPGKTVVSGKDIDIRIREVLYVPGLEFNLLSVPKLEENGFKIVFEDREGRILKNNHPVAIARRNHRIYELDIFEQLNVANIASTVVNETKIWHERYGHIGINNLKQVVNMVDGINPKKLNYNNLKICDSCVEGKQTKLPHNQERTRAKRPLQLVHSDLIGPITPESHDGKRYVLTFIDDFTHFTVAYLLENKSEIFKHFQTYEAMTTAHFGQRISRFRCDNGREYMSKEMMEHFRKKGIQVEYTIRYTPQQNGVAERMNRTIIEKARCMILHSKLNKIFWSEAVLSAIYIINRSPTTTLKNMVPAELWFGKKPDVRKLKVFGCVAHLHIPKELNPRKFDSRSTRCIMIGYTNNGYRLWSLESQRIINGRDVIFDETKFLTHKQQPYVDTSNSEDSNSDLSVEQDETDQYETASERQEPSYPPDKLIATEKEELEASDEEEFVPRRSTREKKPPKHLDDYCVLALHAETYVEDVPRCYADVDSRDDKEEWKKAINEELEAIRSNKTWSLVELPKGRKAINNKWIFKFKRDESGTVERYKARLVVKGCSQIKGFDYHETYAPVARLTTLRILLSIIVTENLHADRLDVKNAFLHGTLSEEVYMKQPEGCEDGTSRVCKLNKTLYGLKQSPRAWNLEFIEYVRTIGLKQSEYDKCIFYESNEQTRTYLLLYVDDIIVAGNNRSRLTEVKHLLKNRFSMKDLGPLTGFLGIRINRKRHTMDLDQTTYLTNLLKRFGMEDCKPVRTPMEPNTVNLTQQVKIMDDTIHPYRELIGCLMYVMLNTRPDISSAVNYYSRFQGAATEEHWKGLKRILRYLKGTMDMCLRFHKSQSPKITVYADADWGGDRDRKSTTGFLIETLGNPVCWTTKKQPTVALSSTEAEYVALANASTETIWTRNLLEELGWKLEGPIIMHEDNQACIHLLSKWEHQRLKHIDIKYNFVRDLNNDGIIKVVYVPSEHQKADLLTKGLAATKFEKLRNLFNLK